METSLHDSQRDAGYIESYNGDLWRLNDMQVDSSQMDRCHKINSRTKSGFKELKLYAEGITWKRPLFRNGEPETDENVPLEQMMYYQRVPRNVDVKIFPQQRFQKKLTEFEKFSTLLWFFIHIMYIMSSTLLTQPVQRKYISHNMFISRTPLKSKNFISAYE